LPNPSSSSLFIFNGCLPWNFYELSHGIFPFLQPSSSTLKVKSELKQTKNHMRKRRRKPNNLGGFGAATTMACGGHHGQAVVAFGSHALDLSLRCILAHLLGQWFLSWFTRVGSFLAFLQPSWIHLSSIFITFS